jgi:prevent-host-death family protein
VRAVAVLLRYAPMERIPQRSLRNDISAVLRRVMAGERLRVTVAGRDAADLVPVDDEPAWTRGDRARELINAAQADPGLAAELADAFPDSTDEI